MLLLSFVSLALTIIYLIVFLRFKRGWLSQRPFSSLSSQSNYPFLSVIIPFKNEAENLPLLIKQLQNQTYPTESFEIIFIDDHSTDASVEIIPQQSNFSIRTSDGKGKKAALKTGIEKAKGEFIVTSDADCTFTPDWLLSIAEWLNNSKASMLIGPVTIKQGNSFLHDFQAIEYYALQLSGAAAANLNQPLFCSGANLIFPRQKWFETKKYVAGQNFESGDDVFLLHAFKKAGEKIDFLNNPKALVSSRPVSSWQKLIKQRMRWGGKSIAYKDAATILMAILVFLTNFFLVLLFILSPFYTSGGRIFLYSALIKITTDLLYLYSAPDFFNIKIKAVRLFIFTIIYPFWISAIAVLGLLNREKW